MGNNKKTEIKKGITSLSPEQKWNLLASYVKMDKGTTDLCKEYNIREDTLRTFISTLYKRFQQAREMKLLIANQHSPHLFSIMKKKYVDSEHINRLFLERVSGEEELVLTDNEILFCEFLIEYGDEVKAIEKSKLTVGLRKDSKELYEEACRLRAFYLKRKPNVANYLNQEKKRTLRTLDNGKEFIQENLITLIEQLKASGDTRHLTSYLKAIEQLARTIGAYEDKVTVNNLSGDNVLDQMLAKARVVNSVPQESVELLEVNE